MSDVDEIIYFIKSLKRGFDKNLFQSKIDELAYAVDTNSLSYDDFHTLFKVWLNLSIPAMEFESINMVTLDMGYEVFYTILSSEFLTVHALKLVYTLTKPADVTRRRVRELLEYAKIRETKKSYKPECVPEDIPTISVHAAFKKLNEPLLTRFKRNQERRNRLRKEINYLQWINPLNSDRSRNKKADPLVPTIHFNEDSNLYGKESTKTHLEFSDLHHTVSRPARLRALLCNTTGLTLLAASPHPEQAFLSHDLHHILHSLESLSRTYRRAQPAEQCAVLRALTTMYTNL
ncbi:Centromere protein I, partial [Operophtera brumata]